MSYPLLSGFAKLVVFATFVLIFIGGLVTSWQAGMAVPDWPLSFGSLNPEGWWGNFPVRLEHGHRLFASCVGLLVTVLCAWVWRNGWPLLVALITSALLGPLAKMAGLPPIMVMHVSIWSFAGAFAAALIWMSRGQHSVHSVAGRYLAFAAFIGVCLQATLGGLRVTIETAGNLSVAMAFRILHGCVAQAELCLLVSLATVISPLWQKLPTSPIRHIALVRKLAWVVFLALFLQIAFGAAMRHMGAGLAIPNFPYVTQSGGIFPQVHNVYIDLNFSHTRVGALAATLLILALAAVTLRVADGVKLLELPIYGLLALLAIQCVLGIYVIWHAKPITLTTIHVVNGAALLATSLLIALRASLFSSVKTLNHPTMPSQRPEDPVYEPRNS